MLKSTNDIKLFDSTDNTVTILYENKKNTITGDVIELQYKIYDKFVLFLTTDIVYENSLYIYLIDANLNILDYVEISSHYATDNFNLISLQQPNIIYFDFLLKKQIWKMEILPKSKWLFSSIFSIEKRKNIYFNKGNLILKKILRN